MNAPDFYTRILIPAAQFLAAVDPMLDSAAARVYGMATAGYESQWTYRQQLNGGPANGFWMCQSNAIADLMASAYAPTLRAVCEALEIPYTTPIWLHVAARYNDALAWAICRGLERCDPHPVPAMGDEEGCWQAYLRAQNPGGRDRERWARVYPQALAAIQSQPQTLPGAPLDAFVVKAADVPHGAGT